GINRNAKNPLFKNPDFDFMWNTLCQYLYILIYKLTVIKKTNSPIKFGKLTRINSERIRF
ncbi:MAG: hypothetical protein AB7U98_12685, partial [Candidatus Nitrosocosmicus sp.]